MNFVLHTAVYSFFNRGTGKIQIGLLQKLKLMIGSVKIDDGSNRTTYLKIIPIKSSLETNFFCFVENEKKVKDMLTTT